MFWELFWDVSWALQGGRARYEGCFFWHFQAAQFILDGLKLSFADPTFVLCAKLTAPPGKG